MSLFEENWDITTDIFDFEKYEFEEFEKRVKCLGNNILDLLDSHFFNIVSANANNAPSTQEDLMLLIEKNKQLKEEIHEKIEEAKQHQTQLESCKQDRKLLTQEIKDTHEALLMAKKYYKKYLKLYHTIEGTEGEKQKIFVQFFTESRKSSGNYSITLLRDKKASTYELIEMIPRLSTFKEIQKRLQDTNNVPAALCCIRQSFLTLKQGK